VTLARSPQIAADIREILGGLNSTIPLSWYTKTPKRSSRSSWSSFSVGCQKVGIVRCTSSTYVWKNTLRTYYGDADEVTPFFIATLPVGYQNVTGGAETTGVEVTGKASHRGTFVYAAADQKKWFDHLLSQISPVLILRCRSPQW
jgi:hypothetical protein